jgi:hypothetical protein
MNGELPPSCEPGSLWFGDVERASGRYLRPQLGWAAEPLESVRIDPVGEVDQRGLRVEAECGGDELRVEGIDEVDEAGAADRAAWMSARIEDVAEVCRRRRCPAGFGNFGDADVRV